MPSKVANSANPMATEAMLVSSSAGLASTRRSTVGEGRPSSRAANRPKRTTAAASRPMVFRSPKPQTPASDSGSSSAMRATPSRAAPPRSVVQRASTGASGTKNAVPAKQGRAGGGADPEQDVVVGVLGDQAGQRLGERAADSEHRADRGDADAGRVRRQQGADRLMPSGMAAMDRPVTARPTTSTARWLVTAQRLDATRLPSPALASSPPDSARKLRTDVQELGSKND